MPPINNIHHKNHIVTWVLRIVVFIALAIVLVLFAKSVKKDTPKENIPAVVENEKVVDMSMVTEVPLTSTSKYGTVSGSYPHFSHVLPSFNDKIKNAVFIAQAEFENNTKENWVARYKTRQSGETVSEFPGADEFNFMISTSYIQVNKNAVSILITIAGFSGGAHGYESLISFNYDVKTGKEITLADIFPNDPNYLKTLSEYSRADLTAQFINKIKNEDLEDDGDFKMTMENINSMLIPGTEPNPENFSVFTITPGFLNIYFAQYQVAAYVYGSQVVKMPL